MFKINILNSPGLQKDDTALELPALETKPAESDVINSKISARSKSNIDTIQNTMETQEYSGPHKKKKKPEKKFRSFLVVVLFLLLASAIIYVYHYTDIADNLMTKISGINNQTPKPEENPFQEPSEQNVETMITVENAVAEEIARDRINISLIAGILELIPANANIYEFDIKDNNLSIICVVRDIISGENLKFYIYNHKEVFKPELFYIEKTDDAQHYQITSLTKILDHSSGLQEFKYKTDRELSGMLSHIAEEYSIEIEPLTISSRNSSIKRKGYIYLTGSHSQLINFCRKLNLIDVNIAFKTLAILENEQASSENLTLKIGITIYPQK